jgi:hypothetical protein
MKSVFFLFAFLIGINSLSCRAQVKQHSGTDSVLISNNFAFEKVYLHLDRSAYQAGEDIWYKAYLVDASTNSLINTSNILYVELYSEGSKLISKEKIQLNNGTGNGDFSLDENLAGGSYVIRAYTNWMRNFGELFFFTKVIDISNPYSGKPATKVSKVKIDNKIDLQFMPEGGSLIEEVLTDVGFKAIDQNGIGCEVKGFVISSEKDTVVSIESTHLGMGRFSFISKSGLSYHASYITKDGTKYSTQLPAANKTGYNIHVSDGNENNFKIVIRTNQSSLKSRSDPRMYISCVARNNVCMAGKIPVDTTINAIFIPKKNFPEGITCISLLDNDLVPQCERLFYIHGKEPMQLIVSADKLEYSAKEKTELSIQVTDTADNPVIANLSLAVTDLDTNKQDLYNSDICTHFLLESDIKGRIEQPGYYFDPRQPDRLKALDLLLLTQGWRNFIWKQLPDSVSSHRYPMETGISVSGRLRQLLINKAIPNATISMVLIDSINSPIVQYTNTDQQGKFLFDGLTFAGNRILIASACDDKNRQRGLLQLDSLNKPRQVESYILKNEYISQIQNAKSQQEAVLDTMPEIRKPFKRKKFSIRDTMEIDQVVVHAKKSPMADDGRYRMYGGIPNRVIEPKDFPAATDMYSLLLQAGGAGMKVSGNCHPGLNIEMSGCRTSVMAGANRVVVLLDGMDLSADNLCSYQPSEIEKIEVLGRSSALVFGSGVCGIVSVFTKKDTPWNTQFHSYVAKMPIEGYYLSRTFYCPEFDGKDIPDNRSKTIFWEPNIVTELNGEAQISFYNKKNKSTIHAQVEGISQNGMPLTGKINYNVK